MAFSLKRNCFIMDQVEQVQSLYIREMRVLTWGIVEMDFGVKLSTLLWIVHTVIVIGILAMMVLFKSSKHESILEKLFSNKITTVLSKCLIYFLAVTSRDMIVSKVTLAIVMSSWYMRTRKLIQSTWSLTSDIIQI